MPSEPTSPESAIRTALSRALATDSKPLTTLRHGTTVATNCILERSGCRVAVLTTSGFADLLWLRRQNRPAIYDLLGQWSDPLVPAEYVLEVTERVRPDGSVERPLDLSEATSLVSRLPRDVDAVAICLLHSHVNPTHERQLRATVLDAMPGIHVSISSDMQVGAGEFERASATVLNCYIAPAIVGYFQRLETRLGEVERTDVARVFVMNSSGGLVGLEVARRFPLLTALSGPAAGVAAAAAVGSRHGRRDLISLDVGGTSSDVAIIPGQLLATSSASIGDIPLGTPIVEMETIGAGGGSVVHVDEAGVVHVGPDSAGAIPGPACYGNGGPFTVTDANLILGRIGSTLAGGEIRLDGSASVNAAVALGRPVEFSPEQLSLAVLRIVCSNIQRAIARVSLERGYDPRTFTLVAFGGAGPQLACEIASEMDLNSVLIPAHPGTLAATGLLLADVKRTYLATLTSGNADDPEANANVEQQFAELRARARAELSDIGQVREENSVEARYAGQTFTLRLDPGGDLTQKFHEAHLQRFGRARPSSPVELVSVRQTATVDMGDPSALRSQDIAATDGYLQRRERSTWFWEQSGELTAVSAPVLERSNCGVGRQICGPALFDQYDSTVVLPPGWFVEILDDLSMLATRT